MSFFSVSPANCLPGWYFVDKFCFQIVPFLGKDISDEYNTFNSARKKCFESGADLAVPQNKSILQRLQAIYRNQSWNIPEAYLRPLLLGAYDGLHVEWRWSDGSQVNPVVWGHGEPKMTKGAKCGVMADLVTNLTSRIWCGWWLKAAYCDQLRGFICEIFPGNEANSYSITFSVDSITFQKNTKTIV